MEIIIIYRISDHSNPEKIKPDYASKENCLRTLVREFGSENLHVLCDNVSEQTHDMVKKYTQNIELTNNALSVPNSSTLGLIVPIQLITKSPSFKPFLLNRDLKNLYPSTSEASMCSLLNDITS